MKKKTVIGAVVIIVVIVGLFGWLTLSRRNRNVEDVVELTEVQKVINKDFEQNYPATPREVVKNYNRIITCFYNETYTDEELYRLGDQARLLFDEELLENNPRDQYFADLKAEIAEYRQESKTIFSTSVCSGNEVEYKTIDGRECAYVTTSYFVKQDKSYSRTYETFVLRKDAEGKWKILVFYLTEGDSSNE
ncbi:MAG: DUF6715 family protein [Roseburia sp.]